MPKHRANALCRAFSIQAFLDSVAVFGGPERTDRARPALTNSDKHHEKYPANREAAQELMDWGNDTMADEFCETSLVFVTILDGDTAIRNAGNPLVAARSGPSWSQSWRAMPLFA
jgi:hypothetical protein